MHLEIHFVWHQQPLTRSIWLACLQGMHNMTSSTCCTLDMHCPKSCMFIFIKDPLAPKEWGGRFESQNVQGPKCVVHWAEKCRIEASTLFISLNIVIRLNCNIVVYYIWFGLSCCCCCCLLLLLIIGAWHPSPSCQLLHPVYRMEQLARGTLMSCSYVVDYK